MDIFTSRTLWLKSAEIFLELTYVYVSTQWCSLPKTLGVANKFK